MQKLDDEICDQIPSKILFRQDSEGIYLTVPSSPDKQPLHMIKRYTVRYFILFGLAIPVCVVVVLGMVFSTSIVTSTLSEFIGGGVILVLMSIGGAVFTAIKARMDRRFAASNMLDFSLTYCGIQITEKKGKTVSFSRSNIRGISKGVLILRGQEEVDILATLADQDRIWMSNVILWALKQTRTQQSRTAGHTQSQS